jgi:hypothetical protein
MVAKTIQSQIEQLGRPRKRTAISPPITSYSKLEIDRGICVKTPIMHLACSGMLTAPHSQLRFISSNSDAALLSGTLTEKAS